MNLLFVCKHNRFRSKVAEALFLKYCKNKNIHVKSCGISVDELRSYVADSVKKILKEDYGVGIVDEVSKRITEDDIKWADKIIIVADNVLLSGVFPLDKTEIWKISDASELDVESIKKSVKEIDKKVKELVGEFSPYS